jgi:hypothetical protein
MSVEQWKPIEGYENYEVSDHGNVRNKATSKILKANLKGVEGNEYRFVGLYKDGKLKQYKIHRLVAQHFISNPENKRNVDHIDRDRFNNNMTNLRWVTLSENQHNKSMHKNNTSGVTGVCWNKAANKWMVAITVNGKPRTIGYFNNLEDAKTAREYAVSQYHGEYAPITINVQNLYMNV